MKKYIATLCFSISLIPFAHAQTMTATIYSTSTADKLGEVTFADSPYGLLITPALSQLPTGTHGFHLHQVANCDHQGTDAGGHYDPATTNSHQGPYGQGHLGDLPVLIVNADGQANTPTLAPRLKTTDLTGLSIMVHAGSDNYSDNPAMGGGGARMACGVVTVKSAQ